jgi:hypothetical protein
MGQFLLYFLSVSDFSATAWISNNGYSSPLGDYQSAELINEMRAARYLLETPCDLTATTGIYANPVDGWNKCKQIYHLVQCSHTQILYLSPNENFTMNCINLPVS